jgi:LmbE family N-acetylglucosaminyl deacetylase
MKRPHLRVARVLLLLCAVAIAVLVPRTSSQFPPAPGTGPGLAETLEAIDSARVTTRILYVTAHPDDESAAVLTYLARGLHADVALLSVTRGEGGQNGLGPEQAPQLGIIRTQELLAATRGYGVKLFFTRSPDFGFSKTPEETEKIWGEQVLEDMVRVIRTFRPDIVINNWGGVHSGHGHHQATGLLTPKAVQLAADHNAFGGKLDAALPPWSGGEQRAVQILDLDRSGGSSAAGYLLPLDDYSPLWGKTYRQMGLDGFANHRTQGISAFLGSPFLRRPMALVPESGAKFDPTTLALPLRSIFPGCRAFEQADDDLVSARAAALHLDWAASTRSLAAAADKASHWMTQCPWHLTNSLGQQFMVADMNRPAARIEKALALAAGLQVTADADRSELVAGESFSLSSKTACRADAGCAPGDTKLVFRGNFEETKRSGEPSKGLELTVRVLPQSATTPLPTPSASAQAASAQALLPGGATREPSDDIDDLLPEPRALVSVDQQISIDGYPLHYNQPATHIEASSTRVDQVPLRLVPAYTLTVEPKQVIEPLATAPKPFDILLRVHSYATQAAQVSVGLSAPAGWQTQPPVSVAFSGSGDQYARLTVTPPAKLAAGNFTVTPYAKRGGETFSTSLEPLPTLPTRFWSEPAQCVAHAFEITVPEKLRVGYVTAENEPVPEALQRLGIHVEMLDAAALAFGDLSRFDSIVIGVRAYELRSDLAGANQRLLDYVSSGGTLVVQYQRDFAWDRASYAPYPAKISGAGATMLPRITDETSPVTFLKPDDPLLNRPNKITEHDFDGWVQERGLYFWTDFDSKYTALLGMHDPGEAQQNGALVYTRYGKGTYIYTGIAFFRQLPEGVAGAYRLFVNLLSASRR